MGKSTLMNSLVGERVSIVSPKQQTTRHQIMGVVTGQDFQVAYYDTPGVLRPNYKLQVRGGGGAGDGGVAALVLVMWAWSVR